MSEATEEIERNREHPKERFSGSERLFNLDELTRKMLDEELDDVHVKQGHRQFTLVKEGPLTIALFHFEEGGELTKHQVDGTTSFHVLDGQIEVETDLSQQVLSDNDYFVMESGVDHSIYAFEESRAVLTIARDPKD